MTGDCLLAAGLRSAPRVALLASSSLAPESTLGSAFVLARARRDRHDRVVRTAPVTARKVRTPHMRRRPSRSPLRIGSGCRSTAACGRGSSLRRARGQSVSRDQIAADPHAVGVECLRSPSLGRSHRTSTVRTITRSPLRPSAPGRSRRSLSRNAIVAPPARVAEPGGAISQDRASTRSSFRGRAGAPTGHSAAGELGEAAGLATGEERDSDRHDPRGLHSGQHGHRDCRVPGDGPVRRRRQPFHLSSPLHPCVRSSSSMERAWLPTGLLSLEAAISASSDARPPVVLVSESAGSAFRVLRAM
jgi:hypothetical protein